MKRIYRWSARQSGATITIDGVDADDLAVKIKVTEIRGNAEVADWPQATAEDGTFYELR